MQKIILMGNLGQDPEMKYTPSGTAVTNFSIATQERIPKERDGETVECPDGWGEYGKYWTQTTWWRCAAWRGLAEVIANNFHKGDGIYVEGKAAGETAGGNQNPRTWTGNDGNVNASYEITVTTFHFLPGKREGGSRREAAEEPAGYRVDAGSDGMNDIPF